MPDPIKQLIEISKAPSDKEAFESWLTGQDASAFLKDNAQQDQFVVYAGYESTFMHAMLVPTSLVHPPDTEDLMAWNSNAASSWGICTSSNPPDIFIAPPLDHTGSKTLDQGEQLVFARSFEGRIDDKSYFDVLQKFVHLFDLHYLAERNAYCRLDKHGDIEDLIRIVRIPGKGDRWGGTFITFKRGLLDEYMVLTDSVIARTFDFTRFRSGDFSGWSQTEGPEYVSDGDLLYKSRIEVGHASYMRGVQIVRPVLSKETVYKRYARSWEEEDRQYASFIALDWKNNTVKEISTASGHTANYFTKSGLPFETSPAFFRPEVLTKYKADSEKYRLQDRSISCRGAWHLQTYDINDAGQVHTYIVYLGHLPYEEQLHWKAYNETPKGPISKRAFTTDFEGSWDEEYEPLNSLKQAVRELNREQVPWWSLRSEKLIDQVHYPATSSADEWANEILQLDQLVVEGFEEKWLRQKAKSLGRTVDPQNGSLKLVDECLIALGFEEDHARTLTAPLHEVHSLRSKLKGHASGKDAQEIKKRTLSEHGTYKDHFRALCSGCDESIRTITETFKKFQS